MTPGVRFMPHFVDAGAREDKGSVMRELITSMLKFSWGMSLFGVKQLGNLLTSLDPNQPRHKIFADGPRSFFATIVDAQFVFEVDAAGRGISMTLLQGGAKITGKRLPE